MLPVLVGPAIVMLSGKNNKEKSRNSAAQFSVAVQLQRTRPE